MDLLPKNNTSRKIIHIDMDAFYASVEMRDNPNIRDKAVLIGGDPNKNKGHGVVATANYIARRYGAHSAMPTAKAVRLIPAEKLVIIQPNFEKYRAVSAKIHQLMHKITDRVESVALDEAYLDVTENKLNLTDPVRIAALLQERIYQKVGLTSSFGVSYNKFLAKMGSEYAKPFGRTVIKSETALDFLAKQPIKNFPGIGPKTQEKLAEMGVYTGADLREISTDILIKKFNRMGYLMAQHVHGIDLRSVVTDSERNRKSIGIERTFNQNLFNENTALTKLRSYSSELEKSLKERCFLANCVVLKVRDANFKTITKRGKLKQGTNDKIVIYDTGRALFAAEKSMLSTGIRLLGLTVTDFEEHPVENISLEIFDNE